MTWIASCGNFVRDQRVQGERGRLRDAPGAAQRHRVRQVDEQADGGDWSAARSRPPRSPRRPAVPACRLRRRRPAQDGVADRPDDVERLLVTEPPLAAGAGQLAGRAGIANVVVPAAAGVELAEDPGQRGQAEPPDRPRGELQLAVLARSGSPGAPAPARSAAARADRRPPGGRGRARPPPGRCRRAWRPGSPGAGLCASSSRSASSSSASVASPSPSGSSPVIALAAASDGPAPVEVGTGVAQRVLQPRHLRCQPSLLHGLAIRSASSWRCSGVSERISRSRGGGAAGERVDQLVEVLRVLREEVAVLAP